MAASEREADAAMLVNPVAVETLLKTISADQKNILTALGLVLDGFESQTKLLQDLAKLAKDDPGPSPLADSMDKLADAFLLVHEGLKGVSARLDHLPAAVRVELEQSATKVGSG